MARENQIVEKDKPSSRRLYRRKGWKGFVHSYNEVTTNGNWEKVKWNKKTTAKEVEEGDFVTVYKF
jgi:hypothetical protein